jgi:anti-sigma-K factor RskA
MSEDEDILAAEFVIGTLAADERAAFAARLDGDPQLRAAVARWQAHFSTLDDAAPLAPSPRTWIAVAGATIGIDRAGGGRDAANVVRLRRRLSNWRAAALATGALAAALAGIVVLDRTSLQEAAGGRYVAVVDADAAEPALIAEVDTAAGTIIVRTLAVEAPPDRSLELWHVPENAAPRSLGVLEASPDGQTIHERLAAGPIAGLIAVSLEPQGGSPSGAPTGPIVYSGRLIPMED